MKKLILSLSLLMALSNSSLYCMNSDKTSLDQKTRIENLRKEVEELTLMRDLRKLNKLKNEEKAETQNLTKKFEQLAKDGITTSIGACLVAGSVYKKADDVYKEALNKESLLNTLTGEKAFGAVNWIKENPGMFTACTITACTISTILVGTLIQKGMKQRGTKPTPTEPVLQEQVFLKPTRLEKDMTKPAAAAPVFPDLISHFNIFMG